MKSCPECGASVEEWAGESVRCVRCGFSPPSPEARASRAPSGPECPRCGTLLLVMSPSCPACGWLRGGRFGLEGMREESRRSRPTPDPDAPTSRKAVWSLLLGALACGCTPLPGLVLGVLALIDLDRNPRRLRGREFAIAGIVMSVIGIPIFGLLLPIACPGYIETRNRTRMRMCQENLTRIDGAKEHWSFKHDRPLGTHPAEADLVGPDRYLKVFPTEPTGASYVIGSIGEDPTCTSGLPGHSLAEVGRSIRTLE